MALIDLVAYVKYIVQVGIHEICFCSKCNVRKSSLVWSKTTSLRQLVRIGLTI